MLIYIYISLSLYIYIYPSPSPLYIYLIIYLLFCYLRQDARNDVQKDTEKPAGLVSPQPCPAPRHPFYPGLLGAGV